jgi:hypothetical protein
MPTVVVEESSNSALSLSLPISIAMEEYVRAGILSLSPLYLSV